MSSDSVGKEAVRGAGWERALRQAVEKPRYGSVEVLVHDGRVVQVETREKLRFTQDRRPDDQWRHAESTGRAHRTPGGFAPSPEESNE
jgi:hypothetical protein